MTGPVSIQPQLSLPRGAEDPAALRKAARQMEAVFVGMLFDEMSKSGGKNALFPKSPGSEMYEGWFRKEVAQQFASSGGVGLGDVIARQLEERHGLASTKTPSPEKRTSRARTGARASDRSRALVHDRRRPSPVPGRVTSAFGPRRHPVTGAMDQHRGIDLAAPVGTPVEVPYGGRVVSVGHDKLLGLHMTVEHMGGWRSLYAHLSSVQVKAGGKVRARQVIARSGASGRVTGPHLHFALYRNGHAVDPARWIRVRQDTDVNTRK